MNGIQHILLIALVVVNFSFSYSYQISDIQSKKLREYEKGSAYSDSYRLFKKYYQKNSDSSLKYSKKILLLVRINNDLLRQAILHDTIGRIYQKRGEFEISNKYLDSSISYFKKNKELYAKHIGDILLMKGGNYTILQKYDKALGENLESLEYIDENNPSYLTICNNLGVIYASIEQYDQSIIYFEKALKSSIQFNRPTLDLTMNLGIVYQLIKDYDQSSIFLERTILLADSTNYTYYSAAGRVNLSNNLAQLGCREESILVAKEAIEIINKGKVAYHQLIVSAQYSIGVSYLEIKEYNQAIEYLTKALELSEKINHKSAIVEASTALYNLYKEKDSFEKALMFFEKAQSYKNDLFKPETFNNILKLQSDYIVKNKNLELETLNEDNIQRTLNTQKENARTIGIIVLLFLSVLVFLFIAYKEKVYLIAKQRTKLAENELKIVKSQLNPYFVTIILDNIKNHIIKSDRISAYRHISKFSNLMRLLLESSRNSELVLTKELDLIATYIDLENQRLDKKINYKLQSSKVIELKLPSLVIFPIIKDIISDSLKKEITFLEILLQYTVVNDSIHFLIKNTTSYHNKKEHKNHSTAQTKRKKYKGFWVNFSTEISNNLKFANTETNISVVLPLS